jgi:hypothetical protein
MKQQIKSVTETSDYIRKRMDIIREINKTVYDPKTMSFEKHAKTEEDRRALKHIKKLFKTKQK